VITKETISKGQRPTLVAQGGGGAVLDELTEESA
jgi:hypothetical protein